MYWRLNFGSYYCHSSHDALDWDKLVYKISFETAWSDMVLSEVSLKVNIVLFSFRRECFVTCLCQCLLLIVALLVVTVILIYSVKLWLKNIDSFDGVLSDISCKILVELSEIVKVDVEPRVLLCHHLSYWLLLSFFSHEFSRSNFHCFLVESRRVDVVVSGVDLHSLPPLIAQNYFDY